jgi:prevent-host-death family protein
VKTISMLEFRKRAEHFISLVRKGQRLILTYRGKPVVRLEPIADEPISADDPIYSLTQLAESKGGSLTNDQIDDIVYGK